MSNEYADICIRIRHREDPKVAGHAQEGSGGRLRVRLWIDADAAELHAVS